jgi:adenosylcobinamide kinase/adenosylcobinamide-phosphate guanylyltransferase
VPLGEINRQFQDEQGRLNQSIATLADKVSFITAGLPIQLKG